jgi:hypothetical protein
MGDLLFRLAVYLPVLFLIAVVVTGQRHVTARETLRDAAQRSVRWMIYTAFLVIGMQVFAWLFIG